MDTLAADLRQATTDLLDVPSTRQRDLLAKSSRNKVVDSDPVTLRPTSKLVLLDADGKECQVGPVPRGGAISTDKETLTEEVTATATMEGLHKHSLTWTAYQDVEDVASPADRLASLSSNTPPLHANTAKARGTADVPSSALTKSDLFQRAISSAYTSGSGNSRLDVWLNEKGERVVNGKVIGRLTLASEQGSYDRSSPRSLASSTSVNAVEEDHLASSTPYIRSNDLPQVSSSEFDHSRHGSHGRSTTPAFFVRSFPHATPGQKDIARANFDSSYRNTILVRPEVGEDVSDSFHDADEDVSDEGTSLVDSLEVKQDPVSLKTAVQSSMLRLPGISRSTNGMGDLHSNLTRLYGHHHRAEQVASPHQERDKEVESSLAQSIPEPTRISSTTSVGSPDTGRGPLTFDATPQGIAWEPWDRPAGVLSPGRSRTIIPVASDDRPLLDRAASLFSAQSVAPLAEREGDFTDALQPADSVTDDNFVHEDAEGSTSLQSDALAAVAERDTDDGESSSLYSLPASSITGSTSEAPSRRPSLRRRTSSNASFLSTASSNHSGSATSSSPRAPRRARSMSSETFTRDVVVRSWTQVGSRTRGYVTYEVVLLTRQGGLTIRAHRRYTSFLALARQLRVDVPQFADALPALPPKDLMHKYSPRHLEARRVALSRWLQLVLLDPRWGGRKAAREWLVGSAS